MLPFYHVRDCLQYSVPASRLLPCPGSSIYVVSNTALVTHDITQRCCKHASSVEKPHLTMDTPTEAPQRRHSNFQRSPQISGKKPLEHALSEPVREAYAL